MGVHAWRMSLLAATGLCRAPGPSSRLALTDGALHGWRRTLFTVAGGAVGFGVLIGLSLFGMNGFVIGPLIAALFVAVWSLFSEDQGGARRP